MSPPAPAVAVIPVKPLGKALVRLSAALEAPVRRELQAAMLTDVLAACAGAGRLDETVVVTGDADVAAIARAAGARLVPDHAPRRGMNAAVALGLDAAAEGGAEAALVLTADLPLVRPEDLEAVVAAAPPAPSATLVPSRDGTGTNAMLLRPPGALTPQLGPDSLARHTAQALRRAVAVCRLGLPRLAVDVDTPADLAAALEGPAAAATREAAARLRVVERLGAGSAL
jgi:2-phospho-L-lactate guanylyltransferase